MVNCHGWSKADLAELPKKQWGILEHPLVKWKKNPFTEQVFTMILCIFNKSEAMKSLDKQRSENYNVKKLLNGYFCNHIVTVMCNKN